MKILNKNVAPYTHKLSFDEISKFDLVVLDRNFIDITCDTLNVYVDQPYGIAVDSNRGVWLSWYANPKDNVWVNWTEVIQN